MWQEPTKLSSKDDQALRNVKNENDLTYLFVSASDLLQHPDVVPQGAVWVQVHADRPQLVQLLLRPTDTQGESPYRLNNTVARVTSAAIDNKDEKNKQINLALKGRFESRDYSRR